MALVNVKDTYGYGQVEPNHLSAQRTAQIYAQAPAASGITSLEQGQFVQYKANNTVVVDGSGVGAWEMVYNEVKLYNKVNQGYKDFAQLASEAMDGEIVPRRFAINVGDIFTTNNVAYDNTVGFGDMAAGDAVLIGTGTGILTYVDGTVVTTAGDEFVIIKKTTMPDGAPALKLRRVQ